MQDEIKVTVVRFPDRKALMLRYVDPLTGKQKHKSARTTIMRDAEREAGKWEKELREGTYCGSRITWDDFRRRYEDEVLSGLSPATDQKVTTVFGLVESHINPQRLALLTAERISLFAAKLREGGRSETTIQSYLAHLKAALKWAESMRLIGKAPVVKRIQRAKAGQKMKGRPITGEEFERMLDKVASVVGSESAPSWQRYLRGLWLSGLRLEESLELWWDRSDRLCVALDGKRPMLSIPAALEKGNKDRLLPMAPEFAEFLLTTPEAERTGRVFPLKCQRVVGERLTTDRVSRLISAIGKKAGIKVNIDRGKVKYASAHDLRRSFGERWSSRVMPAVLQQLMRHESIETTMRYYVGRNAEATADILWEVHKSNSSGNTPTARDNAGCVKPLEIQ